MGRRLGPSAKTGYLMTNIDFDHLTGITPFLAMEIFAKASELERRGRDIIHLEFGEPDFATPPVIADAAIRAIRNSQTRYTDTRGIDSFREAVVQKYRKTYGVEISASSILTSSGSSILLYMAMRLLVPPGDELIVTDPSYACYANLARIGGIKTVEIELRLEEGFLLDVSKVKKAIGPRTKAILINSPTNPTGIVFPDETLKELAELDIPIISDEIYGDLIYEGPKSSMLNFTENCVVLNGLSKYYAMTGWRLGYMILNPAWVNVASYLNQNMMISASQFVQQAGTAAINDADCACRKMALEFDKRRKFLLKRLKESGLDPQYTPNAAFYVLFRYPNQKRGSFDVSLDILEKTGVALTPGIDFGKNGEGFLRFSYANSLENIDEAVKRLQRYFLP